MADSKTTTDHQVIKQWVEERSGQPAVVRGTEEIEPPAGMLRIKFQDSNEDLKTIDWNTFFDTFEKKKLAFLYQEKTDDSRQSRFFKFVERS
ncbi:MAG: hypothetical protein ACLFPE_12465 [Bacteroidales bacterium]